MTETVTPQADLNGSAPAADQPCEDCATPGERGLAIIAGVLGLFVILVAVDMWTGGKLSGMVPVRVPGE